MYRFKLGALIDQLDELLDLHKKVIQLKQYDYDSHTYQFVGPLQEATEQYTAALREFRHRCDEGNNE